MKKPHLEHVHFIISLLPLSPGRKAEMRALAWILQTPRVFRLFPEKKRKKRLFVKSEWKERKPQIIFIF